MSRVLATDEALTAAKQMHQQTGDLLNKINDLQAQANVLVDPNNYDGPEATKFKTDWNGDKTQLQNAVNSLESLRATAQSVVASIMTAGGGSGS